MYAIRSYYELEKRLEGIAEADKIISQVYEEEASLTVRLKEDYKKESETSLGEIKAEINKNLGGFQGSVITLEQGSTASTSGGAGGSAGGFGANPGMNLMGMFGIGQQQEKIVINVITSYSIHYTKLYEL